MEHTGKAFRHLRLRWSLVAILMALPACSFGQPTVDSRPSPIPGIELIGPSQPEFKDIIATLVPGQSSRANLAPVLPYSVLVRNSGTRTVVSYVVCFEFARADGTKGPDRNQIRDYRTSEPKLAGSVSHLITPIGELTQAVAASRSGSVPPTQGYADDLGQFTTVTAFLDAALYDDGEFVGPDIHGNFEFLSVTAEYARIAKQLTSMRGEPDDTVMAWLDQQKRDISGKAGTVTGTASMGHTMAMAEEGVRIRALEDSLRNRETGRFGLLVTAMARAGAVPLVWRRKPGEDR
jgi:hypothetical protein